MRILRHRRLRHSDAQLEQLSVNAVSSPQRVGSAHAANQVANLRAYLRPSRPAPRFPCPIPGESSAVPSDNCGGLHDFETRTPTGPETRQEKPQHPIRDRKSTRLNSSHTVISYAVFCLKKKKKKKIKKITKTEIHNTHTTQQNQKNKRAS